MPFSTTIPLADRRSRVGPVDRRSGSLPDILDELLRIAQQADAYEILVETFDYGIPPTGLAITHKYLNHLRVSGRKLLNRMNQL
ncbi:hypothetical protein [Sphingobium sp. MK2]|uniref:hypothetical protein n=1 Tax=Sphingobium sp. MK2 TaxID=3116540 RepID=UPI0032E362A1